MGIQSKVTSKGQITLPAALRRHLAIGPGDRLAFDIGEDGTVTVRKSTVSIRDLRGIVPYDGPPLTDEDLDRLIDKAREQRARHIIGNLRRR